MALLDQCVAYWRLEEVSGARADSVGTSTLTDTNTVTQMVGKVGMAAHFTAANTEYLTCIDNPALSMGDFDFTIAAWCFPDTATGSRQIVAKRENAISANLEYLLRINVTLEMFIGDGVGASFNLGGGAALVASQWQLVIAWWDAAAGRINMQLNNGAVETSGATAVNPADSARPFFIGGMGAGQLWDGGIDEVGIWKRILTVQERSDLWNGGAGMDPFAAGGGSTLPSRTRISNRIGI